MDAFYASIEQRDNPELRGKPVAVGYGGKRGVVAAASYEARRFGIRSAMSSVVAMRRCPNLVFVLPRFDVYKSVSSQIINIFREYTSKVEPLSLDEAFLDVTKNDKNMRSATLIAQEIKNKIYNQTRLTASAGVSYNKFLAKIASDINKPNGISVITPDKAEIFLEGLAIEKFFGVGKVTAQKMHDLGIITGADLKQFSEVDLARHFGKIGSMYYYFVRGIDNREVESEYVRKSLGSEETFNEDLYEMVDLLAALDDIAIEVHRRAEKRRFYAKTISLKVKYADFEVITRSKTVSNYIRTYDLIFDLAKELILQIEDLESRKVRLLGLTLKNPDISLDTNIPLQLSFNFKE